MPKWDYPRFADPFRNQPGENAEQLAAANGIEIEFLRKRNVRKEDRVKEILRKRSEDPGLVCVFSAHSLREICGGLACCEGQLKHLGLPVAPKRSTLAYANEHRPWELYQVLVPARETPPVTIAAITGYALLKAVGGQVVHELSEYSLVGIHPSLSAICPVLRCGSFARRSARKLQIEKPVILPKLPIVRRLHGFEKI